MDKYSVLMSVYKKVKVEELELSINSMLYQTIQPEQIIVVLDGPVGDELIKLIDRYKSSYPLIFTVVQLKENAGLAVALNEGLKYARNELIARMDSDDYSLPTRCEIQLNEFANNPELVMIGTNTQHFISDYKQPLHEYGKNPVGISNIKKTIKHNSAFSHPTVMFKKSFVERVGGYDNDLRRSQDHDLFTKMIAEGYMVDNIDKPLLLFRIDDDCVLRNRNSDSLKARVLIQKRLLKRSQCSIFDYLYVVFGVFVMRVLPEALYIRLYNIIKK